VKKRFFFWGGGRKKYERRKIKGKMKSKGPNECKRTKLKAKLKGGIICATWEGG
jgi:hypothetical protein